MPAESTDAWLVETDTRVTKAAEANAVLLTPVGLTAAVPPPSMHRHGRTVVPLTRMEALQRMWLRRLKIPVLLLAIIASVTFGVALAISMLSEPVKWPAVETPAPPALPTPLVIPAAPADDQAAAEQAFPRH